MISRSSLLCTVAVALIGVPALAQVPPTSPRTDSARRVGALALLQGADTSLFIDTTRITLVATALRTVHEQLPRLDDIPVGGGRPALTLYQSDTTRHGPLLGRIEAVTLRSDEFAWYGRVSRVGIPAIDELDRRLGVRSVIAHASDISADITLTFDRPVNVERAASLYARVRQVAAAVPARDLDSYSFTNLIDKGRKLAFIFSRGGGDCPAGCTTWDHYYVVYDTVDNSVVVEHENLDTARDTSTISYWDYPTRYSINPYPTLDSLYAGLRDSHWWYREHAVQVLAMLLGSDTGPWRGAGEQSPARFAALKRAALERKRESYSALIDRLGDADRQVAIAALANLRFLSKRNFGADAAGVRSWRQWLDSIAPSNR